MSTPLDECGDLRRFPRRDIMISHCRLVHHQRGVRRNDLVLDGLGEDHPQRRQRPPHGHGTASSFGEIGNPGIDVTAAGVGQPHLPESGRDNVLFDVALIGGGRGGLET